MKNFLPLCDASGQTGDGLHLLLCPFAGGSASAFRRWRELRPVGMQVSLAVYPGRDQRMNEACMTSIAALARSVQEHIEATGMDTHRLIVAGHSMGAQVAYEVCANLERSHLTPRGLVISGCHAPHLRSRRLLSHLTDRAFFEQLVAMGGCAPELLGDANLWPVFMPMLRADFQATESYWHTEPPAPTQKLQTSTLLICGSADDEASYGEVEAWKHWLLNAQGPVVIAGNHFYVTQRPRAFIEHIRHCFEAVPAQLPMHAFS